MTPRDRIPPPPRKGRTKGAQRLSSRHVAALMLLVGLGLLGGLYFAHGNGWFAGGGAGDAPVYYPPEKPESQLYTGTGSAQFSLYAPQYPGSDVVEAARFEDAVGGTMMVVMTSRDDPVEVAEFYRAALADKGFRPRVRGEGERTLVSGGRPSAGLDVMISITKTADGLTRIELADNANMTTGDDRPTDLLFLPDGETSHVRHAPDYP